MFAICSLRCLLDAATLCGCHLWPNKTLSKQLMSLLCCIVVARLKFLPLVESFKSLCQLCVKLSRNMLHRAKQALTGVLGSFYCSRWTHRQIDRHRCPASPLFDAHEWPAELAWAEGSWSQRRALAVRYIWAYKVLQFILSLAAHKPVRVSVQYHISGRKSCTYETLAAPPVKTDEGQGLIVWLWRCQSWFGLAQMFTSWTLTPVQSGHGSDSISPVNTSSQADTEQGLQDLNQRLLETWRQCQKQLRCRKIAVFSQILPSSCILTPSLKHWKALLVSLTESEHNKQKLIIITIVESVLEG